MEDLALEARTGLPEALRVLLEQRPREGWSEDPGFDGLISFWLERHLMFRRLLDAMRTDAEAALDARMDPRAFAQRLSRYGGMFVNELHGHHHIEDAHYFPLLKTRDARVALGFDILDRDHHAMDGILQGFVEVANGTLKTLDRGTDAIGPLHAELGRLERLLNRHLTDEEELVVPVLLLHGTAGFG